MIDLKDFPKLPPRQDSMMAQLDDLRAVANKLGMYDAADALRQAFGEGAEAIRYGCHCDLEPHQQPDGCVIDEGRPQDCIYAVNVGRKERSAGPKRNAYMLTLDPDGVVAFPGGRGTADMVRQARKAGVKVMEVG